VKGLQDAEDLSISIQNGRARLQHPTGTKFL
jgi:hypothetical protein